MVALLGATGPASAADERPNAILFIVDDVSWNDVGCYGNAAARTPNLDRLAEGGLRFTQAFLTASSCSPSRSSIITGRYPHNNGRASELHRPIAANLPWFPRLLREAEEAKERAAKEARETKAAREKAAREEREVDDELAALKKKLGR